MTRDPESQAKAFAATLLAPISLLYLAFLIAPIGFFLSVSLLKYSPEQLYLPQVTTENYERLLLDGYYRQIIYDTFRISAIVTVITAVLGYALAYFLSRMRSAWRGLLMFLIIAPLMTGVIVRTYGWIVLLGRDGLVNQILIWLGLIDQPVGFLNTEPTVIMALIHIMLPYMVFPIFSSLASQDPHLVPAASTLGARSARAFFEITLPLSRSGIVMGAALVFTLTAGSIVTPELLGGRNVTMMGQTIYQLILSTFNWPLGAAVAAVLVLCQFTVISLYFRKTRRGY
ncbi:ABC transporter permease [Microvirga sp. RSM25]|jgi:ABC-type spermidine/putrescine transport system permease subunit I|uniref:ABC transporter permease n=1 Tax=Microvirga sp. RSM25 TaxID=3273802 RepID=UPI00384D1D03